MASKTPTHARKRSRINQSLRLLSGWKVRGAQQKLRQAGRQPGSRTAGHKNIHTKTTQEQNVKRQTRGETENAMFTLDSNNIILSNTLYHPPSNPCTRASQSSPPRQVAFSRVKAREACSRQKTSTKKVRGCDALKAQHPRSQTFQRLTPRRRNIQGGIKLSQCQAAHQNKRKSSQGNPPSASQRH